MDKITQLFEVSRKSSSHPLEGLRGIAVFLVFLVHYVSSVAPWTTATGTAEVIHTIGSTGVDLFFVLSGFLIYGSLIAKEQPFLPFMGRRIQRIYPAFLFVLAIYVALSYAAPSESRIPDGAGLAAIYLVQNILLLPGIFPIEPIITVAWSLSYEMMFYIVVPLIVSVLALRNWSMHMRAILIALGTVACLLLLSGEYQRIVMFAAGIAVYELSKSQLRAPVAVLAIACACIALAATLFPLPTELRRLAICLGFTALCWHCVSRPSWLSAAMSWAPLRWYGNMSYSYYLVHGLVLKTMFLVVAIVVPASIDISLLMLVPAFIATLIPSALLFVFVERPLSLSPQKSLAGNEPLPVVVGPSGHG